MTGDAVTCWFEKEGGQGTWIYRVREIDWIGPPRFPTALLATWVD
ncbi:hypothetical protein [Gordonia asplenii]|nr:hypothetical protein [Gordonia asplenii]